MVGITLLYCMCEGMGRTVQNIHTYIYANRQTDIHILEMSLRKQRKSKERKLTGGVEGGSGVEEDEEVDIVLIGRILALSKVGR